MKSWMVKSEPEAYSFAQFQKDKATAWTGVRSFQARNFMKEMAKGDQVFFYHSVTGKQVVGLATVSKTAFPDPTVEADEKGEWFCVELKAGKAFKNRVSLEEIKAHSRLKNLLLVRQSRLSVIPIPEAEASILRQLGGV